MAKMNFGGSIEDVVTRAEFPLEKARKVLEKEVIAVIGYGVQGPAQALNLRDNGFNVIIGQRKPSSSSSSSSSSYKKAIEDGWVEGKTLFSIEEAVKRGTIICYLLSDAAQIELWPKIKKYLTPEKTLYFSHGFAINFSKQTGIVPPKNIDVIMVAPKGAGRTVRKHFLEGSGINSSYAIYQNVSGHAENTVKAMGVGIGSGFLFKTTFAKEVCSDLTGERGVLVGAIAGLMEAQYNLLRKHGHTPSEAFNETVEEATQSLYPLVGENGMDWMIGACSTTAQRGALDWKDKFRDAVAPVFDDLYKSVESGHEAKVVIEANSKPDYREGLTKELDAIKNSEMWRAGKKVRELRPERQKNR
ncbi:ketol-acid reductoisomerase [Patescibacteria group bacterium]|nr:ketol-acid reductoisomerase [Patescibacteria group bacterium]